jgi:hypothetical protein
LLQGSELICVVQVFFAHFAMAMAASRDIKGIASHPNALVAGAQSIAFHALTILVHDVKELITSNVMPSIKRSLRSLDKVEQVHGENLPNCLAKGFASIGLVTCRRTTECHVS